MAFGTGLHPTTQMCLAELERLLQPGAKVLDMGTGSGILAIAAAKLGAGRVLAVDNDPVAVRTARANVAANGVQDTVDVMCGSLKTVSQDFDLVLVNILARVIVEMLQGELVARVRDEGVLVTAGIIADQEPQVIAAMEQEGLSLTQRRQEEDWVCLTARRTYAFSD
jgi:ribosomal protein L11 methyltransferase